MHEPREWPEDEAPSLKSAAVTLVGIRPTIPGPVYATTVGDKRLLLAGTTGRLFAFWRGQYTADMFHVPRALAEDQIGVADEAKAKRDPRVEKLLQWWFDEANVRQGCATVRLSRAHAEVRGAKLLLNAAHGLRIKAVGQFALTDAYWKGRVLTVAALWKMWDRVLADWERAGKPEYEERS